MNKQIVGRVQHKHDVEANWLKATNFIPLDGELIVYDADADHTAPRFKVGDGETVVSALSFSSAEADLGDALSIDLTDADQGTANLINADTLGGVVASDFVTQLELDAVQLEIASNISNTQSTLQSSISDLSSSVSTNYATKKEMNETVESIKADCLLKTEAAADANKAYGHTLDSLKTYMLDLAHPVGSYYWSNKSTNPSTLFGGTWEQVKDTFILAAGDSYTAGETGGEAEHTLIVNEMPKHVHQWKGHTTGNGGSSGSYKIPIVGSDTLEMNGTNGMQYAGGGQPHNNMPPYLVAYCWFRTA